MPCGLTNTGRSDSALSVGSESTSDARSHARDRQYRLVLMHGARWLMGVAQPASNRGIHSETHYVGEPRSLYDATRGGSRPGVVSAQGARGCSPCTTSVIPSKL